MSVATKKKIMKRKSVAGTVKKVVKIKKQTYANVDISSSESEGETQVAVERNVNSQVDDHDVISEETAHERKLRLTKEYLGKLGSLRKSDDEEGEDVVGKMLNENVLEKYGRLQKNVADSCKEPTPSDIFTYRGHKLSPTCVAISKDGLWLFTGSKDCSIIKWCTKTGKKLHKIKGGPKEKPELTHSSHVLCITISTDNKFLVSGGKDKLIHVWNPEDMSHIHVFRGHRDAVTGVALRMNSHQLFSSSLDKCVKVWSLDMMAYVETLFGHQDGIQSCDSLTRERCATAGGRDGSIRIFKIVEESQLVYHGHKGCIDCLKLINEEYMMSGSDDGSIALWSVMKKKPIFTMKNAHKNEDGGDTTWITAIGTLINSNLVASGASDGFVRVWKCADKYMGMGLLFKIPVKGFINGLEFSSDGKYIFIAVGQEHRLGRWWSNKEARNSLIIAQIIP